MALSYVEYVGTAGGTTGPFSYGSVALLDEDTESISTQIRVYKNGSLLTITTDYTLDTINAEVDTIVPVFNTDTLRVVRETKADARYIDYVDSTNVTAELLDLDSNQLFFLIQENRDLQTDAMIKGSDGQWAGQNRRITNISSAVNGTDAVTLNQLNAAVVGALPADLSGIGISVFSGNGSTQDFALPSGIATITDPTDVEVYINGIRQRPTTHYTIVSGSVRITPAPASGDSIMLAYHEGTVSAVLTANSVTNASIQDGSVTVSKISNGSDGQALITTGTSVGWTNITSSHVSGFDTQVRTNRIDQLAAPTGSVSLNSQKITNLSDPSAYSDAATKNYVDTATASAQSSTHSATMTGTTTSVSFNATTSFQVGGFILMIPCLVGTDTKYLQCCGVITSALSSLPTGTTNGVLYETIGGGGVGWEYLFRITYNRTGTGNNSVAFTVVRETGSGTAVNLDTAKSAFISFTKGST